MTAGKHGTADFFLFVDGYNLTAALLDQFVDTVSAPNIEAWGLGDSWKKRAPLGVRDTEIAQEGAFFDTSVGGSHEALQSSVPSSPQAVQRIVTFGRAGEAIGDEFVGLEGAYTHKYGVAAKGEDLQRALAEYSVSGQRDEGTILQPLAAKTADWDTESTPVDYTLDTGQRVAPITSNTQANPSVVTTPVPHGLTSGDIVLISGVSDSDADINGERVVTVIDATSFSVPVDASVSAGTGGSFVRANSANGGVGYLQVTAASGFTNFVGKIRDSADNITYADLIAFADDVSAPFAERVTVAGVVDRYLAFDGDTTGSGSITAFCAFARN